MRSVFGNRTSSIVMVVLIVLLLISMVLVCCLGALAVDPRDTYAIILNKLIGTPLPQDHAISTATQAVIWQLRFPRVLMGCIVGAGLSLAGVVMQASVQNTLAEPYLLGISSGASFGATLSIMLGLAGTPFFSFVGALVASFSVLLLASTGSRLTASKLILSGMILNALFTALSNFIITIAANAEGMLDLKFWTMGSLTRSNWNSLPVVAGLVVVCSLILSTQFRPLNILLMGDEAATTLGITTARRRWLYLGLCAAMVGTLVSQVGTIGFVGLMIPHITRSLVGTDHRRLIPTTMLVGAIFMVWTDTFARILIPNSEVPIGILTAAIGAPFFAYIMISRNYTFKG